jgi:hypothetical protein
MTMTEQFKPALLVYREVLEGDVRKLQGKSNDNPDAGGGARDLRFDFRAFRSVMHRIFSEESVGRGGVPIRTATITYTDDQGVSQTTSMAYWPPAEARWWEDRVSRVHASEALRPELLQTDSGRVFVTFTLFTNNVVRCDYAYEADLRQGEWAPEVCDAILGCIDATDTKNGQKTRNRVPTSGFYDFVSGKRYCHAE